MAELTPMMQQYRTVKERNPDCILFFRLGDFYEMFDEDARIASRELDLTLTSRDHAKDKAPEDKVPMCGVPFHSSAILPASSRRATRSPSASRWKTRRWQRVLSSATSSAS